MSRACSSSMLWVRPDCDAQLKLKTESCEARGPIASGRHWDGTAAPVACPDVEESAPKLAKSGSPSDSSDTGCSEARSASVSPLKGPVVEEVAPKPGNAGTPSASSCVSAAVCAGPERPDPHTRRGVDRGSLRFGCRTGVTGPSPGYPRVMSKSKGHHAVAQTRHPATSSSSGWAAHSGLGQGLGSASHSAHITRDFIVSDDVASVDDVLKCSLWVGEAGVGECARESAHS